MRLKMGHPIMAERVILDRHYIELAILNRIAEALNREVDLTRALKTSLEHLLQLFDLQTGWIFLIDEESGKFYTAAALNLPPALADHPRRMGGTCYCLDTYLEGDMTGAANINAILCSRLKGLRSGTLGLKYHASIPLYAKDKKLGILNVVSANWREIAEDDLRLLHTVGDLMSIAIERARLFQKSVDIGITRERSRLAREIHDTIAQGLTAIILQLEALDALLETGATPENLRSIVQHTLQLSRLNLEETRRSVLDLRAVPLEGQSLTDVLDGLLKTAHAQNGLQVRFEVHGQEPPLSPRVAVGLFRIAQEAIHNVCKHAQADELLVQLQFKTDTIHLIIQDNGCGFDVGQIPQGHYGLIGINERTKLLGGKLTICSETQLGTTLNILIPLSDGHE